MFPNQLRIGFETMVRERSRQLLHTSLGQIQRFTTRQISIFLAVSIEIKSTPDANLIVFLDVDETLGGFLGRNGLSHGEEMDYQRIMDYQRKFYFLQKCGDGCDVIIFQWWYTNDSTDENPYIHPLWIQTTTLSKNSFSIKKKNGKTLLRIFLPQTGSSWIDLQSLVYITTKWCCVVAFE